eukprot:CAMPEP_0181305366 /NCGR_PEP_ID=MMETSP1101-20121128/9687_1 /TAXON_ID=46948 /ORGANISM="Rhodomonas abbreviata, Strain Caron Lab Isolate" /LENGTH=93 /DNA_ID=CAMNT_0023411269 /DNA_START=110 /DNA_END=388 /DNA_ORIENTATION=-
MARSCSAGDGLRDGRLEEVSVHVAAVVDRVQQPRPQHLFGRVRREVEREEARVRLGQSVVSGRRNVHLEGLGELRGAGEAAAPPHEPQERPQI